MYYYNKRIIELNRIFDQNDRRGYIRLDLNENPGGLPSEFIKEVLSGIDSQFLSQYPETNQFTNILSDYLGVNNNNLCLVNGSAEGIRYIIQAFTSENGRIVGVIPSYFMFQIYSEMYGRNFVGVPYNDDLSIDVDNIINSLTNDTELLILLNPNNPMGNVYSDSDFERIIKHAREKQITILVDEAYHYFYPKTFINYAINDEHIFITRTFSKLFSLAGCRLGYVVGCPKGIQLVQKMCTPHNTNAFALRFAEELIKRPDIQNKLIEDFNIGREYLINWLDDHGYVHIGEAGNFLFIKPHSDANAIVAKMKEEKKILIKCYKDVGKYGDCLRVSIGSKEYMQLFTTALEELDK